MAIGEFGEAPVPIGEFGAAPVAGGPVVSNGLYWMYEAGHAALQPARALADVTKLFFKNPLNPLSHTTYGKSMAAGAELFERILHGHRSGPAESGPDDLQRHGSHARAHPKTGAGSWRPHQVLS